MTKTEIPNWRENTIIGNNNTFLLVAHITKHT